MRWPLRRAIRLKVMHIQPGDVVVLESDRLLSAEAAVRLREAWRAFAGLEGVDVIVLDGVKAKAILRRKP
jgi:hypothetical protein